MKIRLYIITHSAFVRFDYAQRPGKEFACRCFDYAQQQILFTHKFPFLFACRCFDSKYFSFTNFFFYLPVAVSATLNSKYFSLTNFLFYLPVAVSTVNTFHSQISFFICLSLFRRKYFSFTNYFLIRITCSYRRAKSKRLRSTANIFHSQFFFDQDNVFLS
jgi:hypothetical protein